MKRSKKQNRLIALLCVLVAACGATFGVLNYNEKKEQIENSDEILFQIDPETVTALSWTNETTSLAFHKEDSQWVYDEDEAFPVSEDEIDYLLTLFENFGVTFAIDDVYGS